MHLCTTDIADTIFWIKTKKACVFNVKMSQEPGALIVRGHSVFVSGYEHYFKRHKIFYTYVTLLS